MRGILKIYALPVALLCIGIYVAVTVGRKELRGIHSWKTFISAMNHNDIPAAAKAIDAFRIAKPDQEYRALIADGLLSYQLGKWVSAAESFEEAVKHAKTDEERSIALYNLSRAVAEEAMVDESPEMLKSAIEFIQESLRENPANWRAKWNYEVLVRNRTKRVQESVGSPEKKKQSQGGSGLPKPKL